MKPAPPVTTTVLMAHSRTMRAGPDEALRAALRVSSTSFADEATSFGVERRVVGHDDDEVRGRELLRVARDRAHRRSRRSAPAATCGSW